MNLSAEVLTDIMESIKIVLTDIVHGDGVNVTIDELLESFEGSGYETRREWVVRAANELVIQGYIEPGTDPNRPLKPSKSFTMQTKALAAAKVFPQGATCIELVGCVWRLVVWDTKTVGGTSTTTIKDVVEVDFNRLTTVLKMSPWRVTWHAKVINEAIRKLGVERVRSESTEPSELQLRVYQDSIRAKYRSGDHEDEVMEYDLRSCEWRQV